jgi:hypothetical protein
MNQHQESKKVLLKQYKKPSLKIVHIDSELSLAMLSAPPQDPGAGFIEGISKFLIR